MRVAIVVQNIDGIIRVIEQTRTPEAYQRIKDRIGEVDNGYTLIDVKELDPRRS